MHILRRNILQLLVLGSICFAGDIPVRTDREVMIRLCDSLIAAVSADVKEFPSIALSTGIDTASMFFRPYFVQGMFQRNIPVFLKNDPSTATLELHVQGSSVHYGSVFTESFFGERKCERTAALSLFGTLYSARDGKVLFSRLYSVSTADTVAFSLTDQLSASAIPMTGYTRPELSFFDSVLEPAIVTVASGIIIYLFFTIRS